MRKVINYRQVLLLVLQNITIFTLALGQKKINLSLDVVNGISMTRPNTYQYLDDNGTVLTTVRNYQKPALYGGLGFGVNYKKLTIGYEYLFQKYNLNWDYVEKNISSGNEVRSYYKKNDVFYFHKFRLGITALERKNFRLTTAFAYATPGLNFWGFTQGYSVELNESGQETSRFKTYQLRAGAYSLSISPGITSTDKRHSVYFVLSSEWLRHNINRSFGEWYFEETDTWYYALGLRYSYLFRKPDQQH